MRSHQISVSHVYINNDEKKAKIGKVSVSVSRDNSINLAVEAELISKNPFKKIRIPQPQKKPFECFEPQEIREIIKAFYNDNYSPKTSGYSHSHYAHYSDLSITHRAIAGTNPDFPCAAFSL